MGKATSSKASSSTSEPLNQVVKLEAAFLSPPFDPNPLLPLLALAQHQAPEIVHKAIWALHRVFIQFINDGEVGTVKGLRLEGVAAEEEDVRGWVRDRLLEYVDILGGLLRDSEPGLRSSALPLLFSLLTLLSTAMSQPGQPTLHTPYFRILINRLLRPTPSLRGRSSAGEIVPENQVDLVDGMLPSDVVKMAHEDYWAKYDDLRWGFFREVTHALRNDPEPLSHPDNLLGQLVPLTNLPRLQEDLNTFFIPSLAVPASSPTVKKLKPTKSGTKKKRKQDGVVDKLPDWMATYDSDYSSSDTPTAEKGSKRPRIRTTQLSIHASIHSVPSHLNQYTSIWEMVLGTLELDENWTRRILVGLHGDNGILGHMKPERRVRVADWLGGLVDRGGANALLAMNGLFVLMTQFNLDYPYFYERLYGLLDRNVLHVKYRARFFRLLDTFLTSNLLPAALVASFIKRLARLTLNAPPAGIIMVVPFIYNLLKRHPGCMVMIQRRDDDAESTCTDLYDENSPSPSTSNAISSSLWELAALRGHYLASVSTMAKIFEEVFTKPEYNMEDFLDHGYGTLFDTEISRKLNHPPALAVAIDIPNPSLGDVFPVQKAIEDPLVQVDTDVVRRLWRFG